MSSVNRKKQVIDATGAAPGRLATAIVRYLTGKHKVSYVHHRDLGDKVVVENADKIIFSGKKSAQKIYRHHSMHPGGLKETPASKVIHEDPKKVIILAVTKMLPKNKLRSARLNRLTFSK